MVDSYQVLTEAHALETQVAAALNQEGAEYGWILCSALESLHKENHLRSNSQLKSRSESSMAALKQSEFHSHRANLTENKTENLIFGIDELK